MLTYTYQARNADGEAVAGELQAADVAAATLALEKRDLTVVALQSAGRHKLRRHAETGRVPPQDLVAFTRQLATMMDAGLPLVEALSSLEEQTNNKKLKPVLKQVATQVEQGQAFSQALAQHPKVFTEIYVSLIQTGEAGGLLAEILERLATQLEATARLKRKVLMQISDGVQHYLLYVIAGVGAATYGLTRLKRTQWGTEHWDRLKLRLPVAGPLTRKITLAQFARTFSTLTHSGVPILQTLRIAGRTAGNSMLETAAAGMIEAVEKGDSLAAAMAQHPIFPPMLVRMVASGEKTGRVDAMLEKMAEFYSEEIEATLAGLTSLIEPLLIVFIGVVVGGIVICMFLPIFRISDAIK